MIRYVIAVILAVAVVGIAMSAADHGGGVRSEEAVAADVSDLDDAATSLYVDEELPPRGHPGPRRIVEFDLPSESLTTASVEHVEIEPVRENTTAVEFQVEGRAPQVVFVDVPTAIDGSSDSLRLTGTGRQEVLLTLGRDGDGDRVVRVARR